MSEDTPTAMKLFRRVEETPVDWKQTFQECKQGAATVIENAAQFTVGTLFTAHRLFYSTAQGARHFFMYWRLSWKESEQPMEIRLPAEEAIPELKNDSDSL